MKCGDHQEYNKECAACRKAKQEAQRKADNEAVKRDYRLKR